VFKAGANFMVDVYGNLYANNATITGAFSSGKSFSVTNEGYMTASSGKIGGWLITSRYLQSHDTTSAGIKIGRTDKTADWASLDIYSGSRMQLYDKSAIWLFTGSELYNNGDIYLGQGGTITIPSSGGKKIRYFSEGSLTYREPYEGSLNINGTEFYVRSGILFEKW
jgi:hypothetical protein